MAKNIDPASLTAAPAPKTRTKTWKMPEDCSVQSITVRQLTVTDMEQIVALSKTEGPSSLENVIACKLAITEVDGKPVTYATVDLANWSARTLEFVLMAFNALNGKKQGEAESFLAQ